MITLFNHLLIQENPVKVCVISIKIMSTHVVNDFHINPLD